MSSPFDFIDEEYTDAEPFAQKIGKTKRTVLRWMNEPDGLPFAKIGNRHLIHIPTAREWLLSRVRQRNPRRRSMRASV